jgi:hypothetical protein
VNSTTGIGAFSATTIFNFSANNLVLRAVKIADTFRCFTMIDRDAKQTYLFDGVYGKNSIFPCKIPE